MDEVASRSGRAGWLLTDQIVSSATNFALSIAVARTATTEDFGAFSIAATICFASLELGRPLALEPLLVRSSDLRGRGRHDAERGAVSTSACLGCGLAIGMLVLGSALDGTVRAFVLILTLTLPAVLLQDACRLGLIAAGRVVAATVNDVAFASLVVVGLVVLDGLGRSQAEPIFLAWSAAAAVAAVLGLGQLRVMPGFRAVRRWLSGNRHLAPRYVLEYVLDAGGFQTTIILVGLIGGLNAVAALNGARLLLGPIGVFYLAVSSIVITEGSRLRHSGSPRLVALLCITTVVLAVAPLLWVAALTVAPASVGATLLGDSFAATQSVLLLVALYWAGRGGLLGAKLAFRVSGSARTSLRVMMIFSPLAVAASVLGALVDGPRGAVAGLALLTLAAAVYASSSIRGQFPIVLGGTR